MASVAGFATFTAPRTMKFATEEGLHLTFLKFAKDAGAQFRFYLEVVLMSEGASDVMWVRMQTGGERTCWPEFIGVLDTTE
jgi:hypothetical protein